MTASEIRDLTTDEILDRIENAEEEIFRLRFRAVTQEIDNPMLLRTLRRDIARMKTVLNQRQTAEEGSR